MYSIKNKDGETVYMTPACNNAIGFYEGVKKATGYAELWWNDECLLKTK